MVLTGEAPPALLSFRIVMNQYLTEYRLAKVLNRCIHRHHQQQYAKTREYVSYTEHSKWTTIEQKHSDTQCHTERASLHVPTADKPTRLMTMAAAKYSEECPLLREQSVPQYIAIPLGCELLLQQIQLYKQKKLNHTTRNEYHYIPPTLG